MSRINFTLKTVKKILSVVISAALGAGLLSASYPLTAGALTYDVLTYKLIDEDNNGTDDYVEITHCDVSAVNVKIPEKIGGIPTRKIGKEAFVNCTGLKSVSIPESVTEIGIAAFARCSGLESLNVPSGVKSISSYTFRECKGLKSVKLPDGITSIGEGAFKECESLESVSVPESVNSIGSYAFYKCLSLKSVNIPEGVTNIGEQTFLSCLSLDRLFIPHSVTNIDKNAINNCTELKSIVISNPECKIYRHPTTINTGYVGAVFKFDGYFCVHEGSTAQEYAEYCDYTYLFIGDANADGKLSALDASIIFSEYKKLYDGELGSFDQIQKDRSDISGDGKITAIDASKVFSMYKESYRKG